jgi:hypothetical protein
VKRREVVAGLVGLVAHPLLGSSQAGVPDAKPGSLSLIRLIANPSSFDGRRLRLAGYLGYNGIDTAVGLYVSETDGRNAMISESIDLDLDEATAKKFVRHYVVLDATFHAPKGGGSEFLNGSLNHISNLKAWNYGDNHPDAQP